MIYIANRHEGKSRPLVELRLKNESHNFHRRHHWHPRQRPAPTIPKATTGRTSHYVPPRVVTFAVTHSQATRQKKTSAVTGSQGSSSNTSAGIAELFRPDKLSHIHELGLSSTEAHDIAHQMDYRGTFIADYIYATTNLQESCLQRGEK